MATLLDVVEATKGFMDSSNLTTVRNFLVLNNEDFESTDYDDMVSTLQSISTNYIASYAQSLYSKQPSALTDAEKYNIYNVMLQQEYINAWNEWFSILQELGVEITCDFNVDGYLVCYYSFSGATPSPIAWIIYNTPPNGTKIIPKPLVQASNAYTLTSIYLPSYSYNSQTYGWFNNPELSGTALSANATATPDSSGYIRLYTAVPRRIFTMHANGLLDILYPRTNSSAVIMQDGTTLESTLGNVETALSNINTALGGML